MKVKPVQFSTCFAIVHNHKPTEQTEALHREGEVFYHQLCSASGKHLEPKFCVLCTQSQYSIKTDCIWEENCSKAIVKSESSITSELYKNIPPEFLPELFWHILPDAATAVHSVLRACWSSTQFAPVPIPVQHPSAPWCGTEHTLPAVWHHRSCCSVPGVPVLTGWWRSAPRSPPGAAASPPASGSSPAAAWRCTPPSSAAWWRGWSRPNTHTAQFLPQPEVHGGLVLLTCTPAPFNFLHCV